MKNYKKIYNIVVVGVGNIGSRHFQSLAKLDLNFNLFAIDNNKNSIKLAKKRFNSQAIKGKINSIIYLDNINKISINIDLLIVATNSNIRRPIIEKIFKKNKISNIVLEKVCFQSDKDFQKIINITKIHHTRTWVNLAKRYLPLYKFLKENTKNDKKIYIEISAGISEIGSNTIHALDILSFLSNSMIKSIDMSLIENKIYKSKRKGFIDFNGTLKVNTYRGDELILTNLRNTMKPEYISITLQNKFFFIDTNLRIIKKFKKMKDKFQYLSKREYEDLNQSDMTHIIAKGILINNKCKLPSLYESYKLHKPMLKSFILHINRITKKNNTSCKIT